MAYGTYQDYIAMFGEAELTAQKYADILLRATSMIDSFTARQAQSATGYKLDAVKRAECALVRLMAVQDATGQGNGIVSVSNEGYSESYRAVTPADAEQAQRDVCRKWLTGTGLMGAL